MNDKVNVRMCMLCKKRALKLEMIRIVEKDGVFSFDSAGKAQGRGTYICSGGCLEKAMKNKRYSRMFKDPGMKNITVHKGELLNGEK